MREQFFRFWKVSAKPLIGFLLVLSIGLWAWNLVFTYGILTKPTLGVRTPVGHFRACAEEVGLDFFVASEADNRGFAISFGPTHGLGHRHGSVVNALGFAVSFSSNPVDAQCFIVPPHAAVAFPYWFLITLSGGGFLWVSGLLGPIVAGLYGSKQAKIAMAVVLLLFTVLNVLPSDSKNGGNSSRNGCVNWLHMIFFPEYFHLGYGFPFVCYDTVGGRRVDNQGITRGWKSEKAMENLVFALSAAVAAGLGIERLRKSRERAAIPPASPEPASTSFSPGYPPPAPNPDDYRPDSTHLVRR